MPCLTVPPQPDATLLPETVLLQHCPGHTVLIRPGLVIDRSTVLREHCAAGRRDAAAAGALAAEEVDEAFELYRRRLLWQMVKRRWFSALTDFNVERLFTDCDPIFFVRFVGAASAAIAAALSACGDVTDPLSVASLHASGAIKLMLKGGNNVNMIAYRALCCLPPSVSCAICSVACCCWTMRDFEFSLRCFAGGRGATVIGAGWLVRHRLSTDDRLCCRAMASRSEQLPVGARHLPGGCRARDDTAGRGYRGCRACGECCACGRSDMIFCALARCADYRCGFNCTGGSCCSQLQLTVVVDEHRRTDPPCQASRVAPHAEYRAQNAAECSVAGACKGMAQPSTCAPSGIRLLTMHESHAATCGCGCTQDVESAASSAGSTCNNELTPDLPMQHQDPYGGVRNMLSQLQLGEQASVRPCTRRSLRICKSSTAIETADTAIVTDAEGESCVDYGGMLQLHGPSVRLFVSNNQVCVLVCLLASRS